VLGNVRVGRPGNRGLGSACRRARPSCAVPVVVAAPFARRARSIAQPTHVPLKKHRNGAPFLSRLPFHSLSSTLYLRPALINDPSPRDGDPCIFAGHQWLSSEISVAICSGRRNRRGILIVRSFATVGRLRPTKLPGRTYKIRIPYNLPTTSLRFRSGAAYRDSTLLVHVRDCRRTFHLTQQSVASRFTPPKSQAHKARSHFSLKKKNSIIIRSQV